MAAAALAAPGAASEPEKGTAPDSGGGEAREFGGGGPGGWLKALLLLLWFWLIGAIRLVASGHAAICNLVGGGMLLYTFAFKLFFNQAFILGDFAALVSAGIAFIAYGSMGMSLETSKANRVDDKELAAKDKELAAKNRAEDKELAAKIRAEDLTLRAEEISRQSKQLADNQLSAVRLQVRRIDKAG